MQLAYHAYKLELKHTFSIAKFSRNHTPVLLLRITYQGTEGFGEASMVPYMGESFETAAAFLAKTDLNQFRAPFDFPAIISYLDNLAPGQPAIKAAIDIALNDIQGKLLGLPCYEMYGANPAQMPVTSYTLGIDTPEVLREKVADARACKVLKIKLGRDNDRELIQTIRSVSDLPLYVDANQGWSDRKQAIDMIYWLHDQGVLLIEQPMDKTNIDGNAWLTERSPIPILADEAVQRLSDMQAIKGAYHGINVKLMKSAGMFEAHQMILQAKAWGMKVLIGCMSETSCATLAAAALAPLCNWADLDGPLLTKNNPFETPSLQDGKWLLNHSPGLGLNGTASIAFDQYP
ncbi:dipeptide epimerase [Pedobacter sp. SYP-B3415]|uniref:dipeptide epimerase n=1 Tax=Pedobacter sp. SYP-B3415 TaxID=2496641 RepID=UPI00101C86C3|nr:dipeptide epimerase [Pedobacter sp. SYP-B3415]